MFVKTSTATITPPIGVTREQPMLAQFFMSKYGIEIDPHFITHSHFRLQEDWLSVLMKIALHPLKREGARLSSFIVEFLYLGNHKCLFRLTIAIFNKVM